MLALDNKFKRILMAFGVGAIIAIAVILLMPRPTPVAAKSAAVQPLKDIQVTLVLPDHSISPIITVHRWESPHVVRYRPIDSAFDPTKVEDVVDGLWSLSSRDPDKYLTFLDEGAQAKIRQVDSEHNGQLLSPSLANSPFPTDAELRTSFLFTVATQVNGKDYLILVGKQLIQGEEFSGMTLVLVKANDRWLQTFDLSGSQILAAIGSRTYDELIRPPTDEHAAEPVSQPDSSADDSK